MNSGSPRPSRSGRPSRPARPLRSDPRPVPLERGRAVGLLSGLIAFTAGFAASAVLVLTGYGSAPPYYVAITVGLVGVGLIGYFYHRGSVALPAARIWSPVLLRAVTGALGLPAAPVIGVLYVLAAIGVVGNLLVPLIHRR